MSKLIHICASEPHLFGLDDEGLVYHDNFQTDDWTRLGRGRRDRGGPSIVDAAPALGERELAERDGPGSAEARRDVIDR